jgi:type II secretory pathway pseudopilin PulG
MFKKEKGFSTVELLVFISILLLVFLIVTGFIFWFNFSNSKAKADREVLENSRSAMETMAYEIKWAESVYTPTTTSSQLSLKTYDYLPSLEETSYIDFFLCGTRICFKKESYDPIFLTSDAIEVTALEFTHISTNGSESVRIRLAATYKNSSSPGSSVDFTSTSALRSY